ncbi:MAG: hypothetical protein ABI847_02880 [Anaerolineales bacterium]
MPESTVSTSTSAAVSSAPPTQLRQAFDSQQRRFDSQPALIQRYLEAQARQLAETLLSPQGSFQARFSLPDRIVTEPGGPEQAVPADFREQLAGGLVERLTRTTLGAALRQRLAELEESPNRAVALAASLIRHATAVHMVHGMLPAGRSVTYAIEIGEEVPNRPVGAVSETASAITATTDAIAEEAGAPDAGRGELLVPYVPAARRFYLPQWVAFDDEGRLLVNSAGEAEGFVASMQRYLSILHAAVSLAPYIVADEDYQRKRYGMLGQLVNQGRSLARYQTTEIIATIRRRAAAQDLNRGLSLSLPYFDDQRLELRTLNLEVIPAGRIMFIPTFVVRAVREEQAKVAQDTRLNASTRHHLLDELALLEDAFVGPRTP